MQKNLLSLHQQLMANQLSLTKINWLFLSIRLCYLGEKGMKSVHLPWMATDLCGSLQINTQERFCCTSPQGEPQNHLWKHWLHVGFPFWWPMGKLHNPGSLLIHKITRRWRTGGTKHLREAVKCSVSLDPRWRNQTVKTSKIVGCQIERVSAM